MAKILFLSLLVYLNFLTWYHNLPEYYHSLAQEEAQIDAINDSLVVRYDLIETKIKVR